MTKYFSISIPLVDLGIKFTFVVSKEEVKAAIAAERGAVAESGVPDFGYNFLTTGGGVDKFLVFAFSNVAANALNAGDLPRTRTLSGLKDMLLER